MVDGAIVPPKCDGSNLQPPIQPVERVDEGATKRASNYGSAMENRGRAPGSPDFGMLLRQYRLAAALSQEALAERARMSTQGISALERGYRRTPQRETLALLSGALALSDEQREEFETAAARSVLLGRGASVTVGPGSPLQAPPCPWRRPASSGERPSSMRLPRSCVSVAASNHYSKEGAFPVGP